MVPRFQWTASSESVRDLSRLVAYCTALRAMPKYQCPCGGPCKQASVSGGWCGECSGIKRGQRGGAFGAGVDYQKRTCQKHPLPAAAAAATAAPTRKRKSTSPPPDARLPPGLESWLGRRLRLRISEEEWDERDANEPLPTSCKLLIAVLAPDADGEHTDFREGVTHQLCTAFGISRTTWI